MDYFSPVDTSKNGLMCLIFLRWKKAAMHILLTKSSMFSVELKYAPRFVTQGVGCTGVSTTRTGSSESD